MPKSRPPFPTAFRQQMVELVRTGRAPGELAREFEPSAEANRKWVSQADRDAGVPRAPHIARRDRSVSASSRFGTGGLHASVLCDQEVTHGSLAFPVRRVGCALAAR